MSEQEKQTELRAIKAELKKLFYRYESTQFPQLIGEALEAMRAWAKVEEIISSKIQEDGAGDT